MARNTKSLSGPAKRKYLREAFAAEPTIDKAVAARLLDRLDSEVAQVRVRMPVRDRKLAVMVPAERVPEPHPFDPHAFSLVVVMSKQGAEGLSQRLAAIADPVHLRAIGKAQHIAVDDALQSPADIQAALVAGTAQRIADRRAAAS